MAYLGQKHCMELADVTKDSLCALIDDAMQTAQPYLDRPPAPPCGGK